MAQTQRVSQNPDLQYIRNAMRISILGREEELELARAWQQKRDQVSLHQLIRAYMRLVVAIAAKFKNYNLPMGDLIQEGNIGLMLAAERFDAERNVRFSTYASWWVRAQIQDYILRNWSIVRTGTTASQKSLFFNFNRLRAKIDRLGNRHLSDAERKKIATELGVNVNDVNMMEQRLSGGDTSLSMTIGDDNDSSLQDLIADKRPTPEDYVIGMKDGISRSRWLQNALQQLTPRERLIIHRRRLQEEGDTLESLGAELGVSKERVRQLETRAIKKLQESLKDKVEEKEDWFGSAA